MLLCPEAYTWCPIGQACQKLDAVKYSRLESSNKGINLWMHSHAFLITKIFIYYVCIIEDEDAKVDLADVSVLHKRTGMPFERYLTFKSVLSAHERQEVLQYAKLVGKKCISSLLLYRK